MKKLIKISTLTFAVYLLINTSQQAAAQQLYGFQIPSRQVFYFTCGFNGKPYLGAGFAQRRFGVWDKHNVDVSTEIQFPLSDMYMFRNFEWITGGAGLFPNNSRKNWGAGAYLHVIRHVSDKGKYLTLAPQLSFLPSYTYAAPLDDKPAGVVGLRASFQPAIVTWKHDNGKAKSISYLGGYRWHVGLHTDLLIKRTLALTIDPYKTFQKKAGDVLPPLSDKGNFRFSWGQWYPEIVKKR